VKRSRAWKWSLAGLAVFLLVAGGVWLTNSVPFHDRSIVIDKPKRNGTVENGRAYDKASVDLGGAKSVVLPHNAVVRRNDDGGVIHLFMEKKLSFGGHPPEPMSIRDARKNMGCAIKSDGESVVVATFGEWDSRIEGGASMKLVVVVPEGVKVEQIKGLSGPDSVAHKSDGKWLAKPPDAKGGYWYGPASPTEGWTAVPESTDPARTVR
jgi:hypothetical protein